MHLDTLTGIDPLKVCVGYRADGTLLEEFPADAHLLGHVEPIYATLPGWSEELGGCRHWNDLPVPARDYVRLISERLATPVRMIGVGPSREQMIPVGHEV
jgi:adenylosuccinate synthase